jgi:ABC-type branched-subunit amino acid transport system ATPase component
MGYRWNQPAYSLSYANRRRLEIARATATQPRAPPRRAARGMNPVETHEITELIGELRDEGGYTILVIEHDMHVVEGSRIA